MLNIKTLSILAIAGSAAAAPQWGNWAGKYFSGGSSDNNQEAAATAVEVVTAYTTVTYGGHWNGGNWGGSQPSATASPVAASSPAPVAAAPAQPAASSPAASSGSSDAGYMGIVETWRAKLGLSDLTEDSTLQANALKTAVDGNGQMVHELNPGSFAQVLAPGSPDEFEKVFVGGWLCERADLSGLDGICSTMSQGWAYDGQTGHADILVSKSYSKIGCACSGGIWACDLA